jgi:deoxyribodipyrimidine photo-lyase
MSRHQSIVWLRRDLRLHDHPSLHGALQQSLPVQPIFIFDTDILARFSNPNDRRLTFLASICLNIDEQLKQRGGGLLVLYGKTSEIWPKLANALEVKQVFAAEDYEPETQKRDTRIKALLDSAAVFSLVKDHVIMAPNEVLKDDGTTYKVFTPYSRRWRERLNPASLAEFVVNDVGRYANFSANLNACKQAGIKVIDLSAGCEKLLEQIGYKPSNISLWPVDDGQHRLKVFAVQNAANYKQTRDFMAIHGTSRLSPYIRFGLVSIRECARHAFEIQGSDAWVSELIWRDFYQMILYHYPDTPTQEFNPAYRGILNWSHDEQLFEKFKQGKTGFPIVDAAMRELLETGWMHNRSRMIVASFMTKDLLLDWRLGEEHFAQHLMDYELASNVGGWQWAASTGTDAQPYFRIFNPLLQSKKFDEEGEYIRKYVPELEFMPTRDIHEPHKKAKPANYPQPIVNHDEMRLRTLAMFKQAETKKAS